MRGDTACPVALPFCHARTARGVAMASEWAEHLPRRRLRERGQPGARRGVPSDPSDPSRNRRAAEQRLESPHRDVARGSPAALRRQEEAAGIGSRPREQQHLKLSVLSLNPDVSANWKWACVRATRAPRIRARRVLLQVRQFTLIILVRRRISWIGRRASPPRRPGACNNSDAATESHRSSPREHLHRCRGGRVGISIAIRARRE